MPAAAALSVGPHTMRTHPQSLQPESPTPSPNTHTHTHARALKKMHLAPSLSTATPCSISASTVACSLLL